jgi:uncharacterized membrane protein
MAKTGIFHHAGTFLLFASAILLLITTISAPVVHDIGLLKVMLSNSSSIRHSSVTFGTFGHCVLDVATADNTDADWCTGVHIGYNPADIMAQIDQTSFNTASKDTSKALTRVMVLHPVACGLTFIAFLLALGAGFVGAIFAAATALLAWVITVVVLACDFTLFGIIKNHVNSNRDASGSSAKFGVGMWTELAAMILLLIATLLVLLTCCSSRMHKQNKNSKVMDAGYGAGTTTTHKRHFWQRRTRY